MRLTSTELDTIRLCTRSAFGSNCVVRIFGSRVDDERRGGDIDLHVVAPAKLATLANEIAFKLDLKDRLGEQRIDVVLRAENFTARPIDIIAQESGVVLA